MKTISFLNMKGGVAKTTTSLNVATGLAMKGYKVLLVDLDPQANSTSIYVLPTRDLITVGHVLKGEKKLSEVIVNADENLDLVPSYLSLSNIELFIRISAGGRQHDIIKRALKEVKDKYDFCIIDCPPTLSLLPINAMVTSDMIVVPIKPDKFALQGFMETQASINQMKEDYDLDVDYKVLFTIVNRNNDERDIINSIKSRVPHKCLNTQIRNQPKPIVRASARNRAVIKEQSPKIGVAMDYRALVDEIEEEMR